MTEDSFSNGGLYLDPGKAIEHALELVRDGAAAVDLGAVSSHPDARQPGPARETERLAPVLERLREADVSVSIDSFQTETQRWALARGVAMLNDIRGFPDPALYPALAASDCRLVVMHSVQRGRATRARTGADEVQAGIDAFFAERLEALTSAGVARERLILDPGMGFFLGSDPSPSVRVLQNLADLRARFGCPLMVSVSLKSFLGALTGAEVHRRGAATLAAELHAAREGVDWIRTHDVRALRDALAIVHTPESR